MKRYLPTKLMNSTSIKFLMGLMVVGVSVLLFDPVAAQIREGWDDVSSLYASVVAEEDATRIDLPTIEEEIKMKSKATRISTAPIKRQSLESLAVLNFAQIDDFDYGGQTGNLEGITGTLWAKENPGDSFPIEAEKLSIPGRETSDYSLDMNGNKTYDYIPLGENVFGGNPAYDPIDIPNGTPFYFSANFKAGSTVAIDRRMRVALRIDDAGTNTGDWIRLQARNQPVSEARLGLGGSNSNAGAISTTPGEVFQFVVRGTWDGTDEITYEFAVNPSPDLNNVTWTAATGSHTGYTLPQIGRMFLSGTGANAGARLSDIVISDDWADVVTAAAFTGVKINFQNETFTTPAGYLRDFGEAFGLRTAADQGLGAYTYGWISTDGNATPTSLVGQGRDRGGPLSDVQKTTIHMNHPTTLPSGYWEIALDNGDYAVIVEAGDASAFTGGDPEVHRINAEGVNLINNFIPTQNQANQPSQFITGTGTNITVSDGKLTIDYDGGGVNTKITSIEITPAGQNLPPVVADQEFSILEGSPNTTVVGTVVATDPDNTLADLSFSITAGNTNSAFAIDNDGLLTVNNEVALDFCTTQQFVLTVEVSDQEPLTDNAQITVSLTKDLTVSCSPVSPLACTDVVVSLPFSLDFSGGVAGTVEDATCVGTGFTAVLEHSEARRAGDLPISFPTLNGYEPSLMTVTGGNLEIVSQAGIAFCDPTPDVGSTGCSSNNNNQVNTLGVGLQNLTDPILIKTTLDNIVTGVNAAQAGVWFGWDEDNFVKLDVNNNNLELRTESETFDPVSGGAQQIQTNIGASGTTIEIELEIDPGNLTAMAYYTIGAGTRTLLTSGGNSSLPIPADYLTGRNLTGVNDVTFAGVFVSHRNGSQFTATFQDFSVEEINEPPVLTFIGDQSVEEGQTLSVNLSATDANDPLNSLVFGSVNLPSFANLTDNNDGTATLDLTPAIGAANSYPNVEINVTDGTDSDSETITITVTPQANVGPTVLNPITDQTATENVPFSFTVPANTFEDANGDALTYEASLSNNDPLPTWLSFDPNTQEFTGTPASGDVGTITIKVTVSDPDLESTFDEFNLEVEAAPALPWLVNFQDEATTPPAGYFKDFGEAFGPKSNGLSYGWFNYADNTPLDLTTPNNGVGRNRNNPNVSDLRLNTLVHMQGDDIATWTGNRANEAYWEITLPNGWYEVAVSVGDPNQDGSVEETPIHHINVEGTNAINLFAVDSNLPNGDAGRFQAATVTVQVTDGALTIDPKELPGDGSRNTKINFATITPTAAPSSDADILTFSIPEETGAATIDAGSNTVEVEVTVGTNLSALTPTITVSAGASISPESGTAQDFSTSFDYTVTAEDATTTEIWTVTVTEENVAPTVANAIPDQDAIVGVAFSYLIPANTFDDLNSGDVLTLTASLDDDSPLPTWLNFDGTGFSGTPAVGDVGIISVKVTATDPGTLSTFDIFDIDVSEPSSTDADIVSFTLAEEAGAATIDNNTNTVDIEVEPGTDLSNLTPTIGVSPNATIDPASGVAQDFTSAVTYDVTAEDGVTIKTWTVTVTEQAAAPTVANIIPDQTGDEGVAFSYTVPANTFEDANGDALTLTATLDDDNALPIWLTFDGSAFSGTPGAGDVGTITIKVTATDPGNLSTFDEFDLVIAPAPSAETDVVSFSFAEETSPASIDANNHTVDIEVANGTDVSNLTPTIGVSAGASVAPTSGTPQDFSSPVVYTVTAEDGTTTQQWTVTVTEAVAPPFAVNINFQDAATTPPAGYLDDHGQPYGVRTEADQGSSTYTYGWISPVDGTPIDISDQGRNRNIGSVTDLRLNTIIHMDHPTPTNPRGYWEIEVTNGLYQVTVGVGDPSVGGDPEIHRINAEGQNIVDNFEPTGAAGASTRFTTGSGIVEVTDGKLTLDYSGGGVNTKLTYVDIAEFTGNVPPVVANEIPDQTAEADVAFNYTVPANTFEDLDDPSLTLTALLVGDIALPTWLSFDGSAFSGTPTSGDLGSIDVEVTADDGDATVSDIFTITVFDNAVACTPISTLPCDNIAVSLPFSLDFNAEVVNTLFDTDGQGIGFTMVDPPSVNQFPAAPSNPDVPGYEPSLINLDGGELTITSTKGINFQKPPTSQNNNTQVNALGVGAEFTNGIIDVAVDLAQPDFASSATNSSQQGGLWFGLDEDNYIKLVVSKINDANSKVQLLIESIDPNDPASVVIDEFNSANFATTLTNTINLRMELDPINETVAGFFATNGGAETQLENGTIPVPSSFFAGVDHDSDGGTNSLTFAGVFTTHRNAAEAASIDFSFDNFSITQQAVIPALTFTPNAVSESLEAGASGSFTSDLGVNDGTTPTANLSVVYNDGNNWLQLPNSPAALGTLSFGLDASALTPGTYTATVTAAEAGYVDATLEVSLTVTPTGGPLFDILVNFQDPGTIPPAGYIEDHGQAYGLRTEADQGGGQYTYGWIVEAEAGNANATPLNLSVGGNTPGNGRNRAGYPQLSLEQTTLMHMQYNDVDGTNGTSAAGAWEFAVPNGTYQVLVNLGDPDGVGAANPENYDLSVEGTKIIDDFAPGGATGSATMFTDATVQVEVTDGKVTIDAQGGTNTKITWVQITQVNVDPALVFDPTPNSLSLEVGQTETIGNFLATNDNTDPQNATISAVDDNTNAVPTWLSLDGNPVNNAPFTTGSEISFEVNATGLAVGTYTATVTASATGYDDAVITLTAFVYVQQTPQILSAIPADNSIDVLINTSVSSDELVLPNPDDQGIFGINNATITTNTVRLRKVSDQSLIPATVNGTGGGDGIRLTPSLNLEVNTTYQFEVDGVEDLAGVAFAPFNSTFTTGTDGGGPSGNDLDNVSFTNSGNVASGNKFTTLTIGPDGKLYGLTIGGDIHRWDINADGTLANEETLSAWKSGYNNSRTAIGFTFDPDATAGDLIAYITHMSSGLSGAPEWDGKISRLTGPNLATEALIVTNLPRSIRDHLTNSIAFRPGENNVLYFMQGSNSAGGAPDGAWGNRPERLLSAACLRLDLDLLPENQWPLNAQTSDDIAVINAADVNSATTSDGKYNPYHVNAPLTGFGWGTRNAYDLVWHSNGQLYIPTNGTAGGSNSPASVDGTRRPDGSFYNHADADYPVVPAANGNNTQRDFLFRINPASPGGYYGHPNPLRGQFVMNRGSIDVNNYPAGTQPDIDYNGFAFDFEFNKSPNGVIEYRSNAENGNLQGAMLVCRYSGGSDLIALVPDGPDGDIQTFKIGIPGFTGFNDPLDLVEDVSNGNIYVSDYGASTIVLLKPSNQSSPQPVISVAPESITLDQTTGAGPSAAQTISVSNTGNADLTNVSINIIGEDPGEFQSAGTIGTLGQGQTQNISVTFDPSSNGPKFAQLEVSTTEAGVESGIVDLNGLGKTGTGGANEPSLQWIVDTWLGDGVIDVGDDNPATNVIHSSTPNAALLGDEVSAQIFQRAVDAPVTLQVLSVYGPTGVTPIVDFGWYEAGDPNTKTEVFNVDNTPTSNGQTLTPEINGQLEFDPGLTPFGFYNGWLAFGPDRILYSEDNLNTFSGALPHHIRVYPIPGEQNAYLIATEEHITGNDFQDVVVIARNVTPFVPGSLALTFSPDQLDFIVGVDGTDSKTSTLTANGPLSPGDVTITADQPWVTLPNTTVLGSPMTFGVDATGLGQGNFTATVTASAANFADATIAITLSVTEEIVWTYQVNFQDETVPTAPADYLRDIGEAYGVRNDADQGGGTLTYGWVDPGTTTPFDATDNGRVRTGGANDLENSIILMDHPNPAQFGPGDWLFDLPNGTYYVNAGVGDPEFTDSNHDLEANGVEIVSLTPSAGNLFAEGTAIVNVTNGTLRLAQGVGGSNTKVAFVRIAPFDPSSTPPTIQAIFTGNETAPDVYAGSVTVELLATDNSGSGILSLEYSTDGTNFLPYTTPLVFDQVGPVSLSVRAEDNNNNIANEVFDFSIAAPSGALIALENMVKIPGTDIGFPGDLDYTFHNNAEGSGSATQWHETGVMRIHNDGVNDLVITGFIISNDTQFTLPNGELTTAPGPIAPGDFYDLTIEFIETAGNKGVREQTLTIQSNADNGQDVIADLRGGFMTQPEGGNEITAQQVVQAFGYQTNLGPLDPNDSAYPDPAAVDAGANGDLVLSELFVQADLNEPVMAIQMAAFKGGGAESFALIQHNNNNTVSGFEDTFGGNWHQSLLPKTGNNTDVVTGALVNTITTPLANNAFRIRADGQNTSGSPNTDPATGLPVNLGVRTYKLVDGEGNIVPNAYIVIQDYIGGGCGAGSANCDWNDNVYAFFNIRPEGVPTSTTIADANAVVDDPFNYDVSGSFDNGYAGNNLVYSATLGDGSPLPIWLSINPTTGEFSGTPPFNTPSPLTIEVTVTDDNGLTASESFNLDIDGAFGTLLVATPTSLDFGLLVEGDAPATLTLTLENAGPADAPTINLTNLSVGGVDAALFSLDQTNTDLVLDQGETTTLDVIFDPATVGVKEALLSISNDFDAIDLEIPLAATVQDACEAKGFAFDGNEVLTDPNCDAADGSIQVGTVNGTGTVTYTLGAASNTTGLFENLAAGTYTVEAEDEDECIVTQEFVLVEPTITATFETVIAPETCEENDGSAAISFLTGDPADYSISWSDGQTGALAENLTEGTYTATITETATGCFETLVVDILKNCGPACDPVPTPWTNADIGSPAIAGEVCWDPFVETFEVKASGADIWTASDQFHFVSQSVDCDVEIIAFVESQTNTNPWAKAGVMIRESAAANAAAVMMIVTPQQGANLQHRPSTGAPFTYDAPNDNVGGITAPHWVRLVKSGDTYTGYISVDASDPQNPGWVEVNSITVNMGSTVLAGLAVTSHDNSALSTVLFSNVSVSCAGNTAPTAVAAATPTSGAAPLDVQFDGSGSTDSETPNGLTYLWEFGDAANTISTLESPSFTYTAEGSFTATLTVEDPQGETATDQVVITVEPFVAQDPVAEAGADQNVEDSDNSGSELVTLDGSASTDPDGGAIVSYDWSENGSSIATGVSPQVDLPVGVHAITLTVTDDEGDTDTDNLVITVTAGPVVTSAIRLNAAGPTLTYQGNEFIADASTTPLYYDSPHTFTNTGINAPTLYQTERGSDAEGANLTYNIPVPNGTYTVRTHHAELWFGYQGPTGTVGQRVFDIFLEGNLVKDDFDMYDEGVGNGLASAFTVLEFTNIEVTDGNLTIFMDPSANRPSIAGIEVLGVGSSDTEAPSIPDNVVASNITETSFDVSWNPSTDNVEVTGYLVYVNMGGEEIVIATSTPSVTVPNLDAGTAYLVGVSAVDAVGNESDQSQAIIVTTLDGCGVSIIDITSTPISDCDLTDGSISVNANGDNLEYSIDGTNFQSGAVFTGLASGTYTVTVREVGDPTCLATEQESVGEPAGCEGGDCTTPFNLALNKPASQSSVKGNGVPSFANDGNIIGDDNWGADANMMHTDDGDSEAWWAVDLGQLSTIETVVVFNRTDTRPFILNRLSNFYVYISSTPIDGTRTNADLSTDPAITNEFFTGGAGAQESFQFGGVQGQYVMIKLTGSGPLHVAEVEVYGCDDTEPPVCDIDLVSVSSNDESECGAGDGSITVNATGDVEYSIDGGSSYQASNTFNGLDAGSYTVIIRKIGQASCTETYSANPVVLINPAGPSISSVSSQDESNCGAGDGSISINSSDSNLEYSIDGGNSFQGTNTFTELSAGSYNVVIRQNGDAGCTDSYGANPVVINAPSAPTITDVSSTDQTDCEVADGTITVTASGSNLEYSIGGAFQPGNVFTGLAEGNYTITVRDAGNTACVATSSATIGKPAGCEGGGECTTPFNLALNQPATQSSIKGDGVPSFANDGNTIGDDNWGADADMMHTDDGDTQAWWAVDLGQLSTIETVVVFNRTDTRPFILNRLSDFYVYVSASPLDGTRTNADLSTDPAITNEFFTGGAGAQESFQFGGIQGQYVMIKLTGSGPLHVAEVEVYGCDDTEPPVCDIDLVSIASTDESDCGAGDGSITINATGSVEYSIDGGTSYQASNTFSGLSAGSYNVSIRKIGQPSCTESEEGPVVINAPSSPSITNVASTDQSDCEVLDGTITVSATGSNLEYSIGGTFQTSNVFTDLGEGSFTVTVRDAANTACLATSSATISKPAGCEIVCTIPINLALEPGVVASQSSTYGDGEASLAVDGITSGNDPWGSDANVQHTDREEGAWLKIDLGQIGEISTVTIHNRTNPGLYGRLNNFFIFYSDQDIDASRETGDLETDSNIGNFFFPGSAGAIEIIGLGQIEAQYIVIKMSNLLNVRPLHIAELEIDGCPVATGGENSGERVSESTFENELDQEILLSVYPNPYRDNFTLEIEGTLEEGAYLLISNALGQTIARSSVPESRKLELGENLTMGVYWIQLFNGDSVKRIKVMKAR